VVLISPVILVIDNVECVTVDILCCRVVGGEQRNDSGGNYTVER